MVETDLDNRFSDAPGQTLARLALGISVAEPEATSRPGKPVACFHCGEACQAPAITKGEKQFCCQGCLVVHDLLVESGLDQFYDLSLHPGVRIGGIRGGEEWAYLDDPAVAERLLEFTDGATSRVRFQIPAIHCVACVWLLENLFRLRQGIGQCRVDFVRREASFCFGPDKISLRELATLLASIGYKPELTLSELEKPVEDPTRKRQWLQLGVAGFAFGNIMLFSLPVYLGLDSLSGPLFRALFGYLSLALALPVVMYSARDYWRSAWLSMRQRVLTLDVPIALGLVALYAQSAYEIISARGIGYLDSLAGLVFFLLCGRVFQQKTHDRLAFDRDYKSFFPLAITRKTEAREEIVALSSLCVGDHLRIRNGELIPADGRLISGAALIDYSFVTGESEPVGRAVGDYLYAGGQQIGPAIEMQTVKPVSQSYLTSLWSDKAFAKQGSDDLNTLTNRYSRRFTLLVIVVAVSAALFWILSGDLARGVKAFTSVLIVACPCALALAAPFALGTTQRLFARIQVFLKNAFVLERMARVDTIVFDKTGTLTAGQGSGVKFTPHPGPLPSEGERENHSHGVGFAGDEIRWVSLVAGQSTHPHAGRIRDWLSKELASGDPCESNCSNAQMANPARFGNSQRPLEIESFVEKPGLGISAVVEGHSIGLGSRAWLEEDGVGVPGSNVAVGSASYLAIDGEFRGIFAFSNDPRPETERLLQDLAEEHDLILLSGDNERERERYRRLFGPKASLHFNQTPYDKLEFVRRLQESGKTVMMVGDGLNDAGALKQSDVGVAVVERVGVFSPASDVILASSQVPRLRAILKLADRSVRVVKWSFGISAGYNLVGIGIAAAGILSPLICAVFMPLSSISVVLFACGMSNWATRTVGLTKP